MKSKEQQRRRRELRQMQQSDPKIVPKVLAPILGTQVKDSPESTQKCNKLLEEMHRQYRINKKLLKLREKEAMNSLAEREYLEFLQRKREAQILRSELKSLEKKESLIPEAPTTDGK